MFHAALPFTNFAQNYLVPFLSPLSGRSLVIIRYTMSNSFSFDNWDLLLDPASSAVPPLSSLAPSSVSHGAEASAVWAATLGTTPSPTITMGTTPLWAASGESYHPFVSMG